MEALKVIKPKTILLGVLNWGLGHASRSIPIIQALLQSGHQVVLAANGNSAALLQSYFPKCPLLTPPPYLIQLGSSPAINQWQYCQSLPAFWRTLQREKRWLQDIVQQYAIEGIISDGRFGFYHPQLPSVYITHQLQVQTPWGKWFNRKATAFHERIMAPFHAIWVPDNISPGAALAGELSANLHQLSAVSYLGALSRIKPITATPMPQSICISLSGPEPQRTTLENWALTTFQHHPGKVTLLRGQPAITPALATPNHWEVFNSPDATTWAQCISEAEWVICRSGYSTLMDLSVLQKRAILVPTPGQSEQVYLAQYWQQQQWGSYLPQSALQQRAPLFDTISKQAFTPPPKQEAQLSAVLQRWISTL